ncbi:HAD family hydrolase [Paramaledivibacter caminithermalis]|jgi:soluble P-type ATPase|uniref:Soluble P-type ATPase n=1 Tax=Paramaledivibacter caminithermalis (strain DSM 15212 / CIP 107654 / DViRD3) TaxID=1121301 RepID=A0A1M6JL58_PARC5|nr:HAD family hydrolase [Paramaledivibacter caminithermalis]SHJ47410.1 Soluble P-type ATPase [Paramaledivibacter caminithermalis DSM 15212]
MIEINIPYYKKVNIENIVFDYNGTLAVDGRLIDGLKEKLCFISKLVKVYIITADTFGTVKENFRDIDVEVKIITKENGTMDKLNFIKELGSDRTIAVGNGNNDQLMLKESVIGFCILGDEGLSTKALLSSDVVLKDIKDFFDIIINQKRIIATLRK